MAIPFSSSHYDSLQGEGPYAVTIIMDHEPPAAGIETRIRFLFVDRDNGKPVTNLDVVHERTLHAIIVGEDLRAFAHLHPEDFADGLSQKWNGDYSIKYVFPKAGKYAVILDFTVEGKTFQKIFHVTAKGNEKLSEIKRDYSTTKKVGNYAVELKYNSPLTSSNENNLTFHIKNNGRHVVDLGMFLGSEIHAIAVSEDLMLAEHTHSYIPGHYLHAGPMKRRYSGPAIPIRLSFQKEGTYAIFGQFNHNNKTITANFLVNVQQNPEQKRAILIYLAGLALVTAIFVLLIMRLDRKFSK